MFNEPSNTGWIPKAVSVLGALILSFVAGSYATEFDTFPYDPLIEPAFVALKAVRERDRNIERNVGDKSKPTGYCCVKRYDGRGLVKQLPEKSAGGYTLIANGNRCGAKLLSEDGEVVHTWELPFSEVWSSPPHIDDPVSDENLSWRKVHLYPNGDVLAVYTARFNTDTPNGYGLVKVDADSELIWRYPAHVHHDLDVAPDGTIYTLTHTFRSTAENPVLGDPRLGESKAGSRILEDFVLQLSASGEKLQRISIVEAMKRSPYAEAMQTVPSWDTLHTNNVDVITRAFARHHDFADPGDLMLSFRSLDAIAILDVKKRRIAWMRMGSWREQHDPDPLPNGHILLFDNNGMKSSRIIEMNPDDGGIVWTYGARDGTGFHSDVNGEQQRLPGGNVLVTESRSGRVFEVTPKREVVWDYHTREVAKGEQYDYIASILGAHRVPASYLDFRPRE